MNKFTCSCDKNITNTFDALGVYPCGSKSIFLSHRKIEFYLCDCDKIYKLTDGKKWEFVNYDCCEVCLQPKNICVGPDYDCKFGFQGSVKNE